MKKNLQIGFIGAGNMASAMIQGIVKDNHTVKIKVSDPNDSSLKKLNAQFGVEVSKKNADSVIGSDVIILAVKPNVIPELIKEIASNLNDQQIVLSIAAGIRINDINVWSGKDLKVIRAMPNTPALVSEGITGLYACKSVTDEDQKLIMSILEPISKCVWVNDEVLMNSITAVSGSGPAYFYLFMESIANSAETLGIDKKTAKILAIETAKGAIALASQSDDSLQILREKVTSKGGTTAAAIESFIDNNFDEIISNAIRAAYDRSFEISAKLSGKES